MRMNQSAPANDIPSITVKGSEENAHKFLVPGKPSRIVNKKRNIRTSKLHFSI